MTGNQKTGENINLKAFTYVVSLYYSKVSDSNNPCLLQVKAILQCDLMKD